MHFFCTSLYEIWEVYWGPYGAILQKIYSRKYLLVVPVQCTCTVVPIPARSMNFLGSIQLLIVQIMCMIFVKKPVWIWIENYLLCSFWQNRSQTVSLHSICINTSIRYYSTENRYKMDAHISNKEYFDFFS